MFFGLRIEPQLKRRKAKKSTTFFHDTETAVQKPEMPEEKRHRQEEEDDRQPPPPSSSSSLTKGFSLKLTSTENGRKRPPVDLNDPLNKAKRRKQFGDGEDEDEEREQGHHVQESIGELAGGRIQSLEAKKEKEPLVIPLILQNEWREGDAAVGEKKGETDEGEKKWGLSVTKRSNTDDNDSDRMEVDEQDQEQEEVDNPPQTEEEAAISALLAEASGKPKPTNTSTTTVPLIAMNTVPGLEDLANDSDKYRHDVALRPDAPDLEAYDRIPIEDFGTALLRGMGWKEGRPIGRNTKNAIVEPILLEARPQLLGLGATPKPPTEAEIKAKQKKYIKPGEKRVTVPSGDAYVSDRDRAGANTSNSSNSSKVQVKNRVQIRYGDYKGKEGKVVELKEKSQGIVAYVLLRDSDKEVKVYADELKVIESYSTSGSSNRPSSSSSSSNKPSWLRPHLRVRIVSKSLKNGRYYSKKGVIVDVVRNGECIVKMDQDGVLIDNVLERNVETVVPSVGQKVMVVKYDKETSLVGKVATILEKSSSSEVVVVQFDLDFEVMNLGFDDVCELAAAHV